MLERCRSGTQERLSLGLAVRLRAVRLRAVRLRAVRLKAVRLKAVRLKAVMPAQAGSAVPAAAATWAPRPSP